MLELISSLFNDTPTYYAEKKQLSYKKRFIEERLALVLKELNKPFRNLLNSEVYFLDGRDINDLLKEEHTKYLYQEVQETIRDVLNKGILKNTNQIGNYSIFINGLAKAIKSKVELLDLSNHDVLNAESEINKKNNIFRRSSLSREQLNALCYNCYISYMEKCKSIQPILNLLDNFSIDINEIKESKFNHDYERFVKTNVRASKYMGHFIVYAGRYYKHKGWPNDMVKPELVNIKEPSIFLKFIQPDLDLCRNIYSKYISIIKKEDEQLELIETWLQMSGHEFEKEICLLFKEVGIEGYVTKGSDDGGIDLVLNERIAVQCKNHRKRVSPNSLRDFLGSCISKGFEIKLFISSTGYSKKAIEFAFENNILPFDISHIIQLKQRKLTFDQIVRKLKNTEYK